MLGTISLTGLVGGAAGRKQFRTAKNSIIKNHRKDQKGISAQFQAEIDGLQKKINSTTTDKRLNENTRKSRLEKLNSTLESTTKARVYSDQLANAMNVAPKYVTNEQLHLVTERNILLEEKKNTDPALSKDIDAKLEANQKLMEESTVNKKGNEILDKTIATVEKLNPNQKFEVAENEEDSERIITEINEQNIQWNKENPDNQVQVLSDAEIQDAMLQEGFNLNGTKVINKHIARASGATNVAGHEFLHDILAETLNFDPESAKEVGGALANLLISMDPEQFNDSKFVKKLRLYQTFQQDILNIVEQNPEASEAELTKLIESQMGRDVHSQAIEAITLASDAFATGDIYFGDLAKRGSNDVLRRFKQNLQGTMFDKWSMDVEFNDAEDVFNFVKDYNYSIKKGKLTKAQKALLKSKAKGKLMTGVDNRYVGIKKLQESKNFEAADKVNDMYKKGGVNSAFEIAGPDGPYRGMAEKIFDRYLANAQTEDIRQDLLNEKEDIIADILYDPGTETSKARTVLGLIQDYPAYVSRQEEAGEKVAPLSGFINNMLPQRVKESFAKRGAEDVATKSMTDEAVAKEAEGVADEVTQEAGRKTKLKVLADQLNVSKQVDGAVANADVDVTSIFNFKSVPNAAAGTVGELMGISPAKIKSKANLTKSELANAQRFIKKNVGVLIGMMPEGFDSSGKATGVPKTMLDAFYTKRESRAKTKAGLQTQVKRNNIKDSEFLEIFNIFEGVPDRSDRNTSARVIALANLMGKVMTNQSIRKQNPGILSIADGMSKIMFAKSDAKSKESGDVDLNKFEGKEKQKDWLVKFGFATLPKSFWISNGQLVGSGAKYTKQLER